MGVCTAAVRSTKLWERHTMAGVSAVRAHDMLRFEVPFRRWSCSAGVVLNCTRGELRPSRASAEPWGTLLYSGVRRASEA